MRRVTVLLNLAMGDFICFPTTAAEVGEAKRACFTLPKGGAPGIVGAVDGCAIRTVV